MVTGGRGSETVTTPRVKPQAGYGTRAEPKSVAALYGDKLGTRSLNKDHVLFCYYLKMALPLHKSCESCIQVKFIRNL